jgi:Uncharacterized protein conserved in bacteria
MQLNTIVPILRMLDEHKAREFYIDFLGFKVDWEHRFESDFPLYMQVSRGNIVLHISEHYGDCLPGGAIRIEVEGIEELHKEISDKKYKYARPGLESKPWGSREISITDPFGNRIIFYEPITE